ncbi:hypothetical protein EVAR_94482_1 [Eumeta japonica]|uniref:Uncharacterized protein n=1 Tax=Eumeta variegata TaxID=151549 RepID=A0A4C1UWK7_EUMVA|nr:hypothetical protein EVAR_94482_1 [Eumeta japonica]
MNSAEARALESLNKTGLPKLCVVTLSQGRRMSIRLSRMSHRVCTSLSAVRIVKNMPAAGPAAARRSHRPSLAFPTAPHREERECRRILSILEESDSVYEDSTSKNEDEEDHVSVLSHESDTDQDNNSGKEPNS